MSAVGVLYIIGSFQFGGWEKQLLEIVKRLDRRRFHPLVAVLHRRGNLERSFVETGAPIHTVGIHRLFSARSRGRLRTLGAFADDHGARVVQGFNFHGNLYGALVTSPRSGRVLISSEGGIPDHLRLWHQWARRFYHRRSARVLVNSDAVREYAEEIPDRQPGRIRVVWNGVDTARYDPAAVTPVDLRSLGLTPGGPVVGHVGRFRAEKGQMFLLSAFEEVAERVPQARFLLVGGGPDSDKVEAVAAVPPLAGRTAVLGYKEDVRPYLAAMDLFVLPSRSEGMPNALMEAMSMQLACVATRVGGTKELLDEGRTGPIVEYGDRRALADRIVELVENEKLRQRSAVAARARIVEGFSMEIMMDRYQELYEEALGAVGACGRR